MSARDTALERQRERRILADAAARAALAQWALLDLANLADSWAALLPTVVTAVTTAQLSAAQSADAYLDSVLLQQGMDAATDLRTVPQSLAGVASDGRDLVSLLYEPVVTTLTAIGAKAPLSRALASGYARLDLMTRTQVYDAGRVADQVSLTAHPGVEGYVRVVVGATCSRCIVLAGKFYRWNAGFRRHPRCDCVHLASRQADAAGIDQDPERIYRSLTASERKAAGWSEDDQQAIADGADLVQVTNASRSTFTAGGVKYSRDGVTRRALYGGYDYNPRTGELVRRPRGSPRKPPRLMPEAIYARAGGDREEALRLLRENGFIAPKVIGGRLNVGASPARSFAARFDATQTGDRALAAVKHGLGRPARSSALTVAQRRSLDEYRGARYSSINGYLRGGPGTAELRRDVARIDAAIAASPVGSTIAVWRGSATGRGMFGDLLAGDMTGVEWRETAYMSVSASARTGALFAGRPGAQGVLMRILVPPGTHGVQLSGASVESEILLERGLRLRVVRDHGVSPDGPRVLDVEVVRG